MRNKKNKPVMIEKRKGARSIKEIPANILAALNEGKIETANLMEWLATDKLLLLKNILRAHKKIAYEKPILAALKNLKKPNLNRINETIGTSLGTTIIKQKDTDFLVALKKHPSDIVRCWAAYALGFHPSLNLKNKLEEIYAFAADNHFGVREVAWMAMRPTIIEQYEESIKMLSKWAIAENPFIRRFASEVTRPRGVWCMHFEALKNNPQLALPILEPLKSDRAKYVQDSVGNWLNDASKTQPIFIENLCKNWEESSPTVATAYILKKALRTINKQKNTP